MISWLFAIIFVEAVTEIIINAEVFLWLRTFLNKINPSFLGKLIICGYCMSVWISICVAWALPGSFTEYKMIDVLIKIFVLHRLANILHEGFRRWFLRLPLMFVINWVNNPAIEDVQNKDKVVEV